MGAQLGMINGDGPRVEGGAHDSYRIGSGLESRFSKGDH